jgi:hypothetical protein
MLSENRQSLPASPIDNREITMRGDYDRNDWKEIW